MKNLDLVLVCLLIATLSVTLRAGDDSRHNFKPKDGYVPDAETAIAVAVAIWTPIYGKEKIEKEKPYTAKLADGVWIVKGSLPKSKGMKGGVALAEISKDDCRVLRVSHGK